MRRFSLLDIIHPSSIFMIHYLFYFGPAVLLNYFGLLPFEVSNETIQYIILYPFIVIFGSHVLVPAILGISKPSFEYPRLILSSYFQPAFIFGILGVLIIWLVHFKNGFVPAFRDDVSISRITALAGNGFILVPTFALLTVVNLIIIASARLSYSKRIITTIFVIISFLSVASFGFRSPALYTILPGLVAAITYGRGFSSKRRPPIKYILLAPALLVCIIAFGLLREGIALEVILASIGSLKYSLSVNVFNLEQIITHYNENDWLLGVSFWQDILAVIPGVDSKFLGSHLKEILNLEFKGASISVTALGEGFVNFGVAGLVVHALILGVINGFLFERLASSKSFSKRGLLILFSVVFARVVTGGFSAIFFYSLGPIMVIGVMVLSVRFKMRM